MIFPWDAPSETLPAVPDRATVPAAKSTEETIIALQRDFAYAVAYTAVRVHSNHTGLCVTVNTPRGQIVPHGEAKFTDGTTVEFRDIGMPQPGVSTVNNVADLVAMMLDSAKDLGLELVP
jgi:hypothetical protein